ncbi:MAG: aminotransferase class I/II-fold pyridoxal phosphate-dependent enzyme [Lachnospiraceae bacterium]|nr:aminotransferase class I/II-fold pyridoxal phosphate-dependent enzyme [Lachnospiraceae bacterium]
MIFETEKIKNLPVDSIGELPKNKDAIKLNSNESPHKLPKEIQTAVLQELDNMNLYPDANCTDLKNKLAIKLNKDFSLKLTNENIFVANGSDEVLAFLVQAFFENCEKPFIFPSITYCPDVWAELYSAKYRTVANLENFQIDVKGLQTEECSGVYIANPNTTGLVLSLSSVEELVKFHNGKRLVVVDEAYVDFGGESAVQLVEKYDNLLITRSFSKSYGMAGYRLGYAVAHKDIINALSTLKDTFGIVGVNRLSLKAGETVLDYENEVKENISKINSTREWFVIRLHENNFITIPSVTNFVWVKIENRGMPAKEYVDKLKETGIYVRYFGSGWNKDWIRITIGTREQMEKVINAMQ